MKTYSILFLLIFSSVLYSCGLSESDMAGIQLSIDIHNSDNRLQYRLDSIQEVSDYKISLLGIIPENQWGKYIEPHMNVFENEWNSPYKIEKDYELTMESYLSYCETMGYDPKTFIHILNK